MASRARYWMTEVYTENLPDDWRVCMDDIKVPWVEGPVHDKDLYDARKDYDKPHDVQYKKPHIHLIIHFDDVKSLSQLQDWYYFLKPFNNGYFQQIANVRSYFHYLWHDNTFFPSKHEYNKDDVIFHCGARYDEFEALSPAECNQVYADILSWIDVNGISEIATLQKFAFSNNIQDWIFVLNRKSMMLYQYFSSKRNLAGRTEVITYNQEGEYIG